MRRKNDVSSLRYARSFERLQLRTSGFKEMEIGYIWLVISVRNCVKRAIMHEITENERTNEYMNQQANR